MKIFTAICFQAVLFYKAWGLALPFNQNNINPYMTNNFGYNNVNNMAATSGIGAVNPLFTNMPNSFGNFIPNNFASANNIGSNEPLFNTNFGQNNNAPRNNIFANENRITHANAILANEALVGNAVLQNSNLNLVPNNVIMSGTPQQTNLQNGMISNMQFTPVISEVIPSLQYGDISMTGDLPIGGMIKVCGCFPVYGVVNVDGTVPSAGTAIVAESFGNQVIEIVNNCAHQVIG